MILKILNISYLYIINEYLRCFIYKLKISLSGFMKWYSLTLHEWHSCFSVYSLKYCKLPPLILKIWLLQLLQFNLDWQHGNAANISYLYNVPICKRSVCMGVFVCKHPHITYMNFSSFENKSTHYNKLIHK